MARGSLGPYDLRVSTYCSAEAAAWFWRRELWNLAGCVACWFKRLKRLYGPYCTLGLQYDMIKMALCGDCSSESALDEGSYEGKGSHSRFAPGVGLRIYTPPGPLQF